MHLDSTYVYDASNTLVEKLYYTYDAYNNITSNTYYFWVDGAWVIVSSYYNENYYSDGRHTTAIGEVMTAAPSAHHSATRRVLQQGKLRIESQGRSYDLQGRMIR